MILLLINTRKLKWLSSLLTVTVAICCPQLNAQTSNVLSPRVKEYVSIATPKVVLEHVEIIDGTGASPVLDQNLTFESGRITAISPGADIPSTPGTTVLNYKGYAVLPGIVGMHDHLYYWVFPNLAPDGSFDGPLRSREMSFSAPRLYLANGVTTIRTTGSASPYVDLRLKQAIDGGTMAGPHMDVTSPYLQGIGSSSLLISRELTGPEDAKQTVAYWADRGITSFKAYTQITRDELRAAIQEAHKRGLKVTGHLCSITYDEAIDAGIDNIEHGFSTNTANDPDKKPDTCSTSGGEYTLKNMLPDGPDAKRLISALVSHHVAITSTLVSGAAAIAREGSAGVSPQLRPAVLEAMSPTARESYLYWRNRPRRQQSNAQLLQERDMELQRAFVAAGGLLLMGPDPVGIGGNLPGFGDQREIELLVDAGFSPLQAIRIATLNGAIYLGQQDHIGSIAISKNADLLVVKGDPAANINAIENVEIVFKDGVGYDTKKLLDSVKGHYGEY